jgi:uridine kinase
MPTKPISLKAKLLDAPPKNGKYYLVAIDGRGGAGKTTLSKYLVSLVDDFSLICGDDYFEPIEHPIAWGGYNEQRFEKDVIKPLEKAATTVNYRPYDWYSQPHIKDQEVEVNRGVFIDRCYSFSFELDYDLKIWVDTPREIALDRGIGRSTMPKAKAELVWRQLWKPMEDRYIAEVRPLDTSDIVIDGTIDYQLQITS